MVVACVILFLRAGFHLILEALSTSTLLLPGKEITFRRLTLCAEERGSTHKEMFGKFLKV